MDGDTHMQRIEYEAGAKSYKTSLVSVCVCVCVCVFVCEVIWKLILQSRACKTLSNIHKYTLTDVHLLISLFLTLLGRTFISLCLMYKTVRRIHTKCLRTDKWGNVCTPKNVQIYKSWRTLVCAQLSFINPQSTWKSEQVDQPRVPPAPHTHLTINSQCKAPHGY